MKVGFVFLDEEYSALSSFVEGSFLVSIMIKLILGKLPLPRKSSKSAENHGAGVLNSSRYASFSSSRSSDRVSSPNSPPSPIPNSTSQFILINEIEDLHCETLSVENHETGVLNSPSNDSFANLRSSDLASNSNNPAFPNILNHGNSGNLIASSYEALPSFRDVPSSEKQNLFIRKLNLCCIVFDFTDPTKDLKEKEIKRQTLLELVDFVSYANRKFMKNDIQEIKKMVSVNLFRALPSLPRENKALYELHLEEDEEPFMDPTCPHFLIVYEFLDRFIDSPQTDAELAVRYIDQSFVLRLLDLFDSKDLRERESLKTVFHRIYKKFFMHRPFIMEAIKNIFYLFIKTEKHNGIAELLELLGCIIYGFPSREARKLLPVQVLILLHKPKCLLMYHQWLSYCISKLVDRDYKLADTVIRGLLKYWPITNSSKEVVFLRELEQVLKLMKPAQFQCCMVPLFQQIARCLNSSHFEVAGWALFLWTNHGIRYLIMQNQEVLLPIILTAFRENDGRALKGRKLNVEEICNGGPKMFELFDEFVRRFQQDIAGEEVIKSKLEVARLDIDIL